ncbi:MAG: thioredoxin domain-containing protein [Bacteroidales bacterium]|nr:thioredoxin domain-containing protein [Bacteroidales bacterium]
MDTWKDARPNRLVREVSPYLLQHAYNPVDWFPWGEEAFAKAKAENKLLLISIGYSSCHWCHVMEHESFSDERVAKTMNERYVCIKVDREERPDVDQIYMNAVQIITRRGGWPLNCFALPDGRPVYGGTYFPKENWLSILESLDETWKNEPQRIYEVADELAEGIANTEIIRVKADASNVNLNVVLAENLNSCRNQLDFKLGGTLGAPKFPMPGLLKYLLITGQHSQRKDLLAFVDTTLERMANGGIYDHVGGGFFRYSVDEKWFVPHFEKMLYDNAQLIEVYSLAYRLNPNPLYRRVVEETITFVERQLLSSTGGFFSALDADTAGLEGGYYTWGKNEVEQILGYDSELFCVAYGITPTGNWESTNILFRSLTNAQLSSLFGLPEGEIDYRLKTSLTKLKNNRDFRVPPLVDDKIITSWNSLMVSALSTAYLTFGYDKYLQLALSSANYLIDNHVNDDWTLSRITCKGRVYGTALLDDYAYTINALINLYQITKSTVWHDYAVNLAQKTKEIFFDTNSGMFYYTPVGTELITRKMELMDGVMPSASAVMVSNLLALAEHDTSSEYGTIALQMIANVGNHIKQGNVFVHTWALQLLNTILPVAEIKVNGDDLNAAEMLIASKLVYPKLKFLQSTDIPNKYLLCIGNTCQSPTDSSEDIVMWTNAISYEYYV